MMLTYTSDVVPDIEPPCPGSEEGDIVTKVGKEVPRPHHSGTFVYSSRTEDEQIREKIYMKGTKGSVYKYIAGMQWSRVGKEDLG